MRQALEGIVSMRPDVVYTIIFLKDKIYLGTPTVLGMTNEPRGPDRVWVKAGVQSIAKRHQ
jgi:hypothetical protein